MGDQMHSAGVFETGQALRVISHDANEVFCVFYFLYMLFGMHSVWQWDTRNGTAGSIYA